MKKLLLSLVAVSAFVFNTQAQTEQGKYLVGGSAELNTFKNDGASKTNLNFAVIPSVGYFVSDNFAIGTGVGYSYAKGYSATASAQTGAFVVSPFARAYKNITEDFKLFGQLSVPMTFATDKVGNADGSNMVKTGNDNNIGVALSPGVAFFPSKKWGIELSINGLSYNDYRVNNNDGRRVGGSENFSFGANFFAPKLGVQFYL